MTDWGAVSSWVAAGISVAAFGAGTIRAWWHKPQVDWAYSALMKWPETRRHWLEGEITVSNFGDGPAHRVSVMIQRGGHLEGTIATSPLIRPGEAIRCTTSVSADCFDDTFLWVKWTPPPIGRRREKTSPRVRLNEHAELSDKARMSLDAFRRQKIDQSASADATESSDDTQNQSNA